MTIRDERKVAAELEAQPLAALQENAFGAAVIQTLEPLEVAPLEAEVAVEGRAQRRGDVHRIVALDLAGDAGPDVDRVGGQRQRRTR